MPAPASGLFLLTSLPFPDTISSYSCEHIFCNKKDGNHDHLLMFREGGRDPGRVPKAYEQKADYEAELLRLIKEADCQLICLAGYMRILSPYFIGNAPCPVMNIHPALLPSFPGLHGQRQALEYGVKVAGCTVHFVDEGMDSGAIILQKTVPVMDDDTEDTLSARILVQEHQAYSEAIQLFAQGRLEVCGRMVKVKGE